MFIVSAPRCFTIGCSCCQSFPSPKPTLSGIGLSSVENRALPLQAAVVYTVHPTTTANLVIVIIVAYDRHHDDDDEADEESRSHEGHEEVNDDAS